MGCGFCESALSNSVGTLVVDSVVKPVGRQLDYVRHFHDNVEKLRERKNELATARTRLQHEIEGAEGQLLQIEDDVRCLQSKADATLSYVETLENEIQQNKSCLKWCPNWSWRYQLSKKAKKKTMDISELLETISTFGQPGRVGYPATSTLPTIQFLCSKDFVVSKSSKTAFNQIVQALKDDNISMVGLWGMGGVGKTTLVHEVGKQVQAQNPKLFDKVVITTVSQKPNFEAIQDQIAKYIGFDMKTGDGRRSEQELWLRLKKEERILIILDDVWTYVNIKEKIGIPVGEDHKGCKVLLTTRLQQVCVSMDCKEVVPLGCLDGDEAWTLFAMKAGLSESSNDDIQKLAKQIIKKCQGLSIAIVTLGSALKGKSYHGWEAAYRRLKNRRLTEIEDFNEENAYLCLEASFDYLKNMETKICFLLCSLFPEDYKIYVEDLVRFAWGLELYKDTNSINEVRNEVLAAIEILKNSCLLLDCGKRHVKMHDLVREVALWIASPGKEISFAIKSEVAETLPNVGSLKHYTAISFKSNQTRELPEGLAFPNLKIFLHGGVGISGEILQGMKALQVFALDDGWISPAAFQCQSKLRTLKLYRCNLSDISMLGRLKALEILSLNRSGIIELPNEIGDLENLRLLDLSNCAILQRIPHNLIGRLSNLEEVYLHGCRWIKWATENSTAEEESYSSLWELNLLPKLDVLSLDISCQHLPDGFVFRQLRSFKVCIGKQLQVLFWKSDFETCPISRCLRIENSVDAFKQLLEDVESLELQRVGGHRNLVPSLDFGQGGFNKLTSLHLEGCASLKCLIDASKQQMPATATALSNLVELSIREMVGLEELCNGVQPRGFLQNLKTLNMFNCEEMIGGIPILQNLEQLKVKGCKKMQVLFQISEQGSTHHFSLQSLKVVEIDGCNSLKHLFPMCVANGLGQLQTLKISECSQLEEIIQQPEATNICLQSLKVVQIDGCGSLKYLFPMCLGNGLRQLQTLKMRRCGQLEEIIQQPQATNICVQSLREVDVAECDKLTSLSSLSHGQRMENLTRLTIYCCRQFEYTFPISMVEGLPLLNYVWLHNLPEFKGRDGNDIVLTPPSLHNLSVEKCPQLTPFIISAKIQRLTLSGIEEMKQTCNRMVPKLRGELSGKMEYLTIPNSEHLFDSGYNLSSLKSLLLISLTELRVIWNGPIQVENFQNLTVLYISNCLKLRYIFTVTIAQNLPQLSGLSIGYCLALEQIIEQDQTSSQDHLQPICFPNLSKIDISECGSLKCILPVTVVHGGLPKLETLILDGVPKLEEVFEGDEANEEEKVIHLPQFKYLLLHSLPNCASLNPVGYHFVFPSLEEICVGSCPNITTSFSVDSKKSVHAKTQASQSVDEITAQESASAQETTWPLGSNIKWRCQREG
ncbi:hypothetical protein V6N11_004667 [Hibiscus sabdariffa]|uniref:NB-ARC domain-containing protein n=1 Tax=Hibiscus sabdariffa TaxID=183260 RepID=A0ABR2SH32_9ROSI